MHRTARDGQLIDLGVVGARLVRRDRRQPLYRQLVEVVRQSRAQGEHRRLPAEREWAAHLRLARVTVRKALNELAREGLIERRQGAGTFLVPRTMVADTRCDRA